MKTQDVWVLSPAKPQTMARQVLDAQDRAEMWGRFKAERAILAKVFPRGRFSMAEDGRCVLRPRRQDFRDAYVFWDGENVGLFWNARRDLLAEATKGFPQPRPAVDCEDEGIWYFPPAPGLAKALPWFSRREVSEGSRLAFAKARLRVGHPPGRPIVAADGESARPFDRGSVIDELPPPAEGAS